MTPDVFFHIALWKEHSLLEKISKSFIFTINVYYNSKKRPCQAFLKTSQKSNKLCLDYHNFFLKRVDFKSLTRKVLRFIKYNLTFDITLMARFFYMHPKKWKIKKKYLNIYISKFLIFSNKNLIFFKPDRLFFIYEKLKKISMELVFIIS